MKSKFIQEIDKEIERLEQVAKDLRVKYEEADNNSVLLTRFGLEIGKVINQLETLEKFKKTLIKMGMK